MLGEKLGRGLEHYRHRVGRRGRVVDDGVVVEGVLPLFEHDQVVPGAYEGFVAMGQFELKQGFVLLPIGEHDSV